MNRRSDEHEPLVRKQFSAALRLAFWRGLRKRLQHQCNELLSTNRVLAHVSLKNRRNLGLMEAPLEKIVGSTGRYRDFDLAFLPRRRDGEGRWLRVAQAYRQGKQLPPVLLYKVGDAYFVEDGNHRVSVARAQGNKTIAAQVIELDVSRLTPKESCSRLGYALK